MKSTHVLIQLAVLDRQQREICVQMNRHFDEDVCRVLNRGRAGQ